jgi:branched-chain amino acid aminotransferase
MSSRAMSSRIVYFNGRFVPEREARVSIYDSALTYGDMAYEVTRTIHGRPYRLDEHLRRLFHTLAAIGIDPGIDATELERITLDTLARNLPAEAADTDWQIIHNVSRGPAGGFHGAFAPEELRPTLLVSCYPLVERLARLAAAYDTGLDLVIPAQRALPGAVVDPTIKTRSRLHFQRANLQAEAAWPGALALLLDPDGHLAEGTSGNAFLVQRGRLLTPRLTHVLPGVTRGLVLELAADLGLPADEADLTLDDARSADEIFMTSTSIGILHARTLDGRPVGDGRIGPVTRQLRQALYHSVGLDFAEQAQAYAARQATVGR